MKTKSSMRLAVLAAAMVLAAAPLLAEARPVGGPGPGYGHGGGYNGGWNHGGYRGGWGGYRGYWGPGYFWGGVGLGLGLGAIAYSAPYYGYYGGYGGYYAYPGYVAGPAITEYVVVDPAPGDRVMRSAGQPVPSAAHAPDPIFYPKGGQTPARTETDRQECNRWATTQAGAMSDASIFQRATYACMEGRGYTVK